MSKSEKEEIVKGRVKHAWSDYQKKIFKDIAYGTGNTIIIARAGSSKTTSLVEGSRYLPRGKTALFCAFNKHIQEELSVKLPSFILCKTVHSLGFTAIKNRFPGVELDNNKCWKITEKLIGDSDYDLIENLCKAVNFCKFNLVDISSKIEEIIKRYNIDICELELKDFIKYVIKILALCKQDTKTVDYTDMVWFIFVYGIPLEKVDYLFLDETQDMSKLLIEVVLTAVKSNGRVIAVMDNRQVIYSFAGADSLMFDTLKNRLNPTELKLPICYRCPKRSVYLAQTLVPDIVPFTDAIDGEILSVDINNTYKHAKPGSVVLSRLNAPLIKLCMKFLKMNIPSNIMGRDIGANLTYLVNKSKKKKLTEFIKWLNKWETNEKEKLLAKYPKASPEYITDKAECLYMLSENASSIEDLKKNIDNLFQDNNKKNIVLFSSLHKFKGREADDVFVLLDSLRSFNEEENNLKYIAFTRNKKRLFLVYKNSELIEQYEDYITKVL